MTEAVVHEIFDAFITDGDCAPTAHFNPRRGFWETNRPWASVDKGMFNMAFEYSLSDGTTLDDAHATLWSMVEHYATVERMESRWVCLDIDVWDAECATEKS